MRCHKNKTRCTTLKRREVTAPDSTFRTLHMRVRGQSCSHRSDYSKKVGGHFIRIRLKIAKRCGLYLDIFSSVTNNVFRSFSLSGSRCMSDAIIRTKLEPTGKIFWDSQCCLCAWVSAF